MLAGRYTEAESRCPGRVSAHYPCVADGLGQEFTHESRHDSATVVYPGRKEPMQRKGPLSGWPDLNRRPLAPGNSQCFEMTDENEHRSR